MRKIIFSSILVLLIPISSGAQATPESRALQKIRVMFQEQGRVTFSELYNSDQFDADEKAFLGRLYEIFFAVPGFLKSEFEATGEIPTLARIAQSFKIGEPAVKLILTVMEKDGRVPTLFTRDPASQEITELNLPNIQAFLESRRGEVQMTQWEGRPMPSFSVETLDGKLFESTKLAGRKALLYFWFTGCPPCVRIAPILADLHKKYAPRGVQFLGLNADELLDLDTDNQSRLEYVTRQGIAFTNANVDLATHESFGNIQVYPTLFLIQADGSVVSHFVNFQPREKLEPAIEQLLGP